MSEERSNTASSGLDAGRHPYGPRSLAALLPDVTRQAMGKQWATKRSGMGARIALDWTLIVGMHLATVTLPRKLAGGTLTVACAGPVALELQHAADVLIDRVNRHLGHAVVERLRLVNGAVTKLPRRPVARAVDRAMDRTVDRAAIEQRLAGVVAGPVREALAALAAAMQAE